MSDAPAPGESELSQAEIIAFLADPATYGGDVESVEQIDTHASIVFLAGPRVYKLKRAVRYPFLDYSTLDRRHRFCEAEVAINRRTAPTLYEGVTPVVVRDDGLLALGGAGTPVEWLVVMRRFDDAGLFSRLAEAGKLDASLLAAAVDEVAALHNGAEPIGADQPSGGAAAGIDAVIADNVSELADMDEVFDAAAVDAYAAAVRAELRRVADLLDRRAAAGYVRRCHGDLHLANICTFENRPTLFDAIEFNDTIACIDTLYDFAFLLMDLDFRGLERLANEALNRYVARIAAPLETIAGLAALPLFLSVRAAIRAKVLALAPAEKKAEVGRSARAYLATAQRYLAPAPPLLVAIGGASGSGKSAVAHALAPGIGGPPGALVLRSDRIRKQLAGLADDERLPPSAYTAQSHAAVYREMYRRAAAGLAAGRTCIVDAVHGEPAERARAERLAAQAGVAFVGVWLTAPPSVLEARVGTRRRDASDATAAVVRRQLAAGFGAIDWLQVDAGQPLARVVATVRRHLPAPAG